MNKSDIKEWLGGFGCVTIALILIVAILLVLPAILFISATLSGCLIYLGWNLAIAPIFGIAPIVMWWQAFGLGLLLVVISGIGKSVARSTKD